MKYSDMLYRICIVMLCNEQDVQDAIQDTFCRYLEKRPDFRARGYYSGQKSAEDVAEVIQSRVRMYVEENR